jgi:hypothetical protein
LMRVVVVMVLMMRVVVVMVLMMRVVHVVMVLMMRVVHVVMVLMMRVVHVVMHVVMVVVVVVLVVDRSVLRDVGVRNRVRVECLLLVRQIGPGDAPGAIAPHLRPRLGPRLRHRLRVGVVVCAVGVLVVAAVRGKVVGAEDLAASDGGLVVRVYRDDIGVVGVVVGHRQGKAKKR